MAEAEAEAETTFSLRTLFADEWRLLTFREPSSAIARYPLHYLAFGLFWTWLAGVGRYWDNPKAHLLQTAGLGSLAYVVCLALVLWLLIWPLRPRRWTYRNVLTFVTLTAPPAVLYAIPVERFLPLESAQQTNAVFLGVVALWRVILLFVFLRRVAGLSAIAIVVAGLLPLVLIVTALTVLNLEHVVFNLMAGIAETQKSPNDLAYMVVLTLTVVSLHAAPVLLLGYVVLAFMAWRRELRRAVEALKKPDGP